ncbi:MAG: alanyl-tRNA editing protein [Candidatus Heimdallarchaeota archaeon]|nr:alanyl-tRNA editing protein [Candidatus Heimdallarchaeota archaeon]MCK4769109.1 alanyl-tRNA editing protein [Candidatus Heimdallarchaeota archaeon]
MNEEFIMPLYWNAPYQTEVIAKITVVRKNELQFNQTLFYPGGGGQLSDTGSIVYLEEEFPIIETYKDKEGIWHKLDIKKNIDFQENQDVLLRLDWSKRYSYMKPHTAQHLLSHLFHKINDCDTEKANFEELKIDIELSKNLAVDEILNVVSEANRIIEQGVEVKSIIVNQEEYRKDYLGRTRGKKSEEEFVRLIELGGEEGFDLVCCGGIHVKNLAEIRGVFLESKKDHTLKFLVNQKGLLFATEQRGLMLKLEDITAKKGEKLLEIVENKIKENQILQDNSVNLLRLIFHNIHAFSKKINEYSITSFTLPEIDRLPIQSAAKELESNNFVAVHGRNDILYLISTNEKLPANKIAKTLIEEIGTKGGGNKGFAQLSIKNVKEPLQLVEEIISSL